MQAISSLLENQNLSLEPYIQQLMPAIMTCIVRKQLGVRFCTQYVANAPTFTIIQESSVAWYIWSRIAESLYAKQLTTRCNA